MGYLYIKENSHNNKPNKKDTTRVNESIRAEEVRLVDEKGENVVLSIHLMHKKSAQCWFDQLKFRQMQTTCCKNY